MEVADIASQNVRIKYLEDGRKVASVYDVIKVMLGTQNPRDAWFSVKESLIRIFYKVGCR